MTSLDSEALTPIVEIHDDSSGPSAGTIHIYKSPRIYKKKLAKIAGLIQVACGVVSITCGIAIFCVPAVRLADSFITSVPDVCGGVIYCISGIIGLATARRENNRCLITGYMTISTLSSLVAGVNFSLSMLGVSVVYIIDCQYDDNGYCKLTKGETLLVKIVYISSCVMAFVDFVAAIFGSSLTCLVACCNSTTAPYRIFQNEDESRSSPKFANTLLTSVASLESPNTSDGQAYPIIPRTELDLIKQIGHGGYSEVYLAKWNNHDVAAKRLHEECRLEAEFLARLDHPNIVKLIGVIDEKFDFFLVLELCDGGSLRSYLNDHKQQPLGMQFYDWAKQTARPIKYLKEKKIIHKDIKSPNYLLASCGALKLGDFGLAKNVDITISRATETASYPWMAPELLRDNILSPKYDVFAYGIVLWELWTRKMPFEDVVEPAHLAWRICNDNERPEISTDCPNSVADLMRWCWETDWKMRPNMEEVLSQLASAEEEAIANLSK